jgi:2-polyprenyl-6-methoxyphenol hydroxylase-like FAD-dependent oxidoreductase
MAGLLAATVLARHFEHVSIVDSDYYPETPTARSGVPQARHLHVLLTRGYRILEQLFPGISDDWRALGAEVLDLGKDFAWRTPAGWGLRFPSGLEILAASRPLMDFVVRRRVAVLPNVSFVQGATVRALLADESRTRVTGIHVQTRSNEASTMHADLTVDASGRMSRTPEWLKDLGYQPPVETVVDARLGYASRVYVRRPEHERQFRAVFLQAAPPDQPRAGIAFPIEGSRWMVTLCGGGGDFAPTSEQDFIDFARSLPSGEIYNLICSAEPAGPIAGYRRTENRRRHYERLSRLPDNLLVMGDAACAFNPVYGQGITTTALQALMLDEFLNRTRKDVCATSFQQQLAKINATPWALATGEDVRYRGSEAKPALVERLLQAYVHQVMAVSTYDSDARLALLEVFTMVSTPERILHPGVLARVVRGVFRAQAPDDTASENAAARA